MFTMDTMEAPEPGTPGKDGEDEPSHNKLEDMIKELGTALTGKTLYAYRQPLPTNNLDYKSNFYFY